MSNRQRGFIVFCMGSISVGLAFILLHLESRLVLKLTSVRRLFFSYFGIPAWFSIILMVFGIYIFFKRSNED